MKVYVDKLPSACDECPCCNNDVDYGACCNLGAYDYAECHQTIYKHPKCPLQSTSELLQKERIKMMKTLIDTLDSAYAGKEHRYLEISETSFNRILNDVAKETYDTKRKKETRTEIL